SVMSAEGSEQCSVPAIPTHEHCHERRCKGAAMARGDKSAYTTKQKRKARHIEEGYEERGVPVREAAARAWATVNKQSGGGERSGSGRKTPASSKRAARKDSARRAVATKHGHSPNRGNLTSGSRARER